MKRKVLLSIIPFIITLVSCSNGGHFNGRSNPMDSLFGSSTSSKSVFQSSISFNSDGLPVYEHIDIDLTQMNATMVFSQVSDMLSKPSTYLHKIVKVKGPFKPYESTDPDSCYPAIIVQDATACCGNGLEFLLYGVPRCTMEGGNGYPLLNEEATVVGRFETYLEGTSLYVHLVDAVWLKD